MSYALRHGSDMPAEEKLNSPARQLSFLIAVLISTPEPPEPNDLSEEEWKTVKNTVNKLFSSYLLLYTPSDEELGKLAPEWHHIREVAMQAFLQFFNTGIIASVPQMETRIRTYLVPFDLQLGAEFGISATDALDVCTWIVSRLQGALDKATDAAREEHRRRLELLTRADKERWDGERLKSEIQALAGYVEDAVESMYRVGILSRNELAQQFPKTAQIFWEKFSIGRGAGPKILYPTDESVYSLRPLILINADEAMCVSANDIYGALLKNCERVLTSGG